MENNGSCYRQYRIPVPEEFGEVFTHFYFAKNDSRDTVSKTLLPSFQTIMVFNFGEAAVLHSHQDTLLPVEKCVVLGPIKQAFDYSLPPQAEILVVNFKDDAFYRFFGESVVHCGQLLDPDELLEENCFTALWTILAKHPDVNARVDYILSFCRPYLKSRNVIAEQLSNFRGHSLNPIKSVAGIQQQTERNIQLHQRRLFGYTAKEISRYNRFLKALSIIRQPGMQSAKMDWFEVIHECDYYDQSQLIHDFKHYTGLTPTQYLRYQEEICNPV